MKTPANYHKNKNTNSLENAGFTPINIRKIPNLFVRDFSY